MLMIFYDNRVHCILDALFIIVLLTLNWSYSEVFVPHFTVVIYGLHTKSLHLISYVWPLTMLIVVFSVCHGDPVPAQYNADLGIQYFEAVIRKSAFGFIRLAKSTNSLIIAIESSWIVRIDIWDFWQNTQYIIPAT